LGQKKEEEEGQGRKEKNGAWYQVCRGEKDSAGPVCVGVTVKDRGGDEGRCKSCEKEGFALIDHRPLKCLALKCPLPCFCCDLEKHSTPGNMEYLNEPLQRCDKNALVGIVKSLCVSFQETLEHHVDHPEEDNGELNSADVKKYYSQRII
jgi:hypothetical protein